MRKIASKPFSYVRHGGGIAANSRFTFFWSNLAAYLQGGRKLNPNSTPSQAGEEIRE